MASFTELVQALPAELYNEIYDLTFTANASDVDITEEYKPPSTLQVSWDTRNTFASTYYSHSTFYAHTARIKDWLMSLEPYQRQLLQDVRVAPFTLDGTRKTCRALEDEMEVKTNMLFRQGITLQPVEASVIKFKVELGQVLGPAWLSLEDVSRPRYYGEIEDEDWTECCEFCNLMGS